MRILADEHIPNRFVTGLEAEGFDVIRAKDELPEGSPDSDVLEYAIEHDCVIQSEDGDFRGDEIVGESHPGVIACNSRAATGKVVAAVRTIDEYTDDLNGSIVRVPNGWV